MNTNRNLLKEAIAEASAIKEAAIANAKAALEETLTPHLKTMLAAKLQEMEDMDEPEEELEGYDSNEESAEIEELPAEDSEEVELDEPEGESEESDEDDIDIENMSVADLKNLIRDIIDEEQVSNDMDAAPEIENAPEEADELEDAVEEEEIDLNEILAELEDESEEEEVIAENDDCEEDSELETTKAELHEVKAINAVLKRQLHEINTFNAKLLYMNKIFKMSNLSESQKVNVVAAFDKAVNVREAKLIYETVQKQITTQRSTKANITESVRSASKAVGTAQTTKRPEVINEVSDVVRRMQKLAGIITD